MSSEHDQPPDPPAYVLVLDRKQLCLLYAMTYTGGDRASSVSNPLAALVMGVPMPLIADYRVRLDAWHQVEREYPELAEVFKKSRELARDIPHGFRQETDSDC